MTAGSLPLVGPAQNRVDGPLKITGAAKYAADWRPSGLVYAYMVQSTIASGRIASIDAAAARQQSGVIDVLTHENAPRVNAKSTNANDRTLNLLQSDAVLYDRQPIGLVIADTFARAKHAASLVRVRYETAHPRTRLAQGQFYVPNKIHGEESETHRGDPVSALRDAAVKVDAVYTTPVEHHNPMEPHATVAMWDGDRLTVYDATQGVVAARARLAGIFNVPLENVHVIDSFTGGGFGSKGIDVVTLGARLAGCKGRRASRAVGHVAAADVGWRRLSAVDPSAGRAWRRAGRKAARTSARDDVADIDVR